MKQRGKLALPAAFAIGMLSSIAAASAAFGDSAKFTLDVAPSGQEVHQGESRSYAIRLERGSDFTGTVNISATGFHEGTAGSVLSPTVSLSSAIPVVTTQLIVQTSDQTSLDLDHIDITARAGNKKRSVTVTLDVLPARDAGFTLVPSPASLSVTPGDEAVYTVSIARTHYPFSVSLRADGLPVGVDAKFSPNPTRSSVVSLRLRTQDRLAPASYPFTIRGRGAFGEVREVGATLVVTDQGQGLIIENGSPPGNLYPGTSLPLNLKLTNPNNQSIRVSNIVVSFQGSTSEDRCDVNANYELRQFSGRAFKIGANRSVQLTDVVGSRSLPRITMKNLDVSQDDCQGADVFLVYNVTAAGGEG